jgi:hypothetical protein
VASQARVQTLLHRREENGGHRSGQCRPRANAAGLHWAAIQATSERGMGGQAGPPGLNSAHGQ